jgi:hypothetical protein
MCKKKIELVKPVLVAVGAILLFAVLLESLLFLNAWTGFVAFGVDSVTYYGLMVNSNAMGAGVLLSLHYVAGVLVVASLVLPPAMGFVRKRWV